MDNLFEIVVHLHIQLNHLLLSYDNGRLTEFCKKKKLLMTGGSDFHGIYGNKTVTLGTCSTPQEQLDKLMGYKAKKKRAERKAEKEAALKMAE